MARINCKPPIIVQVYLKKGVEKRHIEGDPEECRSI